VDKDFTQVSWDDALAQECRDIVRLAIREDLHRAYDWTTAALVPAGAQGQAVLVARRAGVVAGLEAARVAIEEMDAQITWTPCVPDGGAVDAQAKLAQLHGSARDLLTAERLLLNLIGRMSGIATLTNRYVEAVKHTKARVYDTRKTTPGWRGLEKYAVRCGGGRNHRRGLYDAVLIKDNHLAFGRRQGGAGGFTAAQSVQRARQFLHDLLPADEAARMIIEIEVDSLDELDQVLAAQPDIVLLDNMTPAELKEAVGRRDLAGSAVQLEASGGVDLSTIGAIAQAGIDRISVGAITHSAPSLDVAVEWTD
jgi:nicotinate-nucleotide pyrophosphorylase (carboxylating)